MSLFFLKLVSSDYNLGEDFGLPVSSDNNGIFLSDTPTEKVDPILLQRMTVFLCDRILPVIKEEYSRCTGCNYCGGGCEWAKESHDRASRPPKSMDEYLGGEYDSNLSGHLEMDLCVMKQDMHKHEETGGYILTDEEQIFSLRSYCRKGGKIENLSEQWDDLAESNK